MTSKNDITGDKLQTKAASEEYRNNYDLIFKKPTQLPAQQKPVDVVVKEWPPVKG